MLLLASLLLSACGGKVQDKASGGNTNWLGACRVDADCASGWCAAGACAVSCTAAADCATLDQASCAPPLTSACGISQRLCVPTCDRDGDCANIGGDFTCQAGACQPRCNALPTEAGSPNPEAGPSSVMTATTAVGSTPRPNNRDAGPVDAGPTAVPSTEQPDTGEGCGDTSCESRDGSPSASSSAHVDLDADLDAGDGLCLSGQSLVYKSPGCDGTVVPVCEFPSTDACLKAICGCNGTPAVQIGCGQPIEPFVSDLDCYGDAQAF